MNNEIFVSQEKEVCPHCAGSGFEADGYNPCELCGGDGWVFERDADAYLNGTSVAYQE